MKWFKDLLVEIWGLIASIAFFVAVFAFLVWALSSGHLFRWLREVFSILWFVAGFAAIVFAAMAFTIERDRRQEKSIDANFDEELGEMYEPMEKDPAWQPHPGWREALLARHRAALSSAEASRWGGACTFWTLATGCALASLLMLAVTAWRCIRGSP